MNKDRLPRPTDQQHADAAQHASEHRYDREPARIGRGGALNLLHEKMVWQAKLYQGCDQDKRDAIVSQLIAVKDFLESQGFALPTLEPLVRPVTALVEREQNRLDPIFSERKRKGRPKRSLLEEHQTGAIAALSELWLDFLKLDDRTQRQKLSALSRRISGGWLGKVTLTRLVSARETVSQEGVDHPVVAWAKLYRQHCDVALLLWSHESVIDILIANLNRTHPKN